MSIDEVTTDLALTDLDIQRLHAITENILGFMQEHGGEDRAAFRTDYLKYCALLDNARGLRNLIKIKLE